MIIVAEGISAAGKTTWARAQGGAAWLPENGPAFGAPDRARDLAGAARFWVGRNADRWATALAIEAREGWVLADTDPLKLHYEWCMARAGFQGWEGFAAALEASRTAMIAGRLGLADHWFVKLLPPEQALRQKQGDATRRRGNFAQHQALQPALAEWYEALGRVLPGRVRFGFPDRLERAGMTPLAGRHDPALLDALVRELPVTGV